MAVVKSTLAACALLALALTGAPQEVTPFTEALRGAASALEAKDLARARHMVDRALERDPRSVEAWALRARWAEASGEKDELAYSLHRELRLAIAQGYPRKEIDARRARLLELDPLAKQLFAMNSTFISKLEPVAAQYEKDGRPHSAIRVHLEILSLDPEYGPSLEAVDRISSLPDPSLAEHAKPKDLLADVSAEWIREHDAEHSDWDTRAKWEGENYNTYTDAGYEVLIRCATAMEQMNAFYRVFFQYGTDGGSISRIDLNIFKSRDEYLEKGIGPPAEWTGGHFTGGAVETYAEGGFASVTGTLFHEAAHQFVSLATNAAGWLNEGLASFFEGCRILPNGSVLMNMPATHRLFPLAERMERGWMTSAADGIDPGDTKATPERAPTFRIVLENEYTWGPPWYAPTWGVVYFLYNFQDPVDGRFIYRDAFRVFVDKSGGRVGKGAVKNFEEVVLANPSKPLDIPERRSTSFELPETVEELDPIWKAWTIELREEQMGRLERAHPYKDWARYAVMNDLPQAAMDHFEKGLVATPDDPELLYAFAEFLVDQKNPDRATKLLLEAARSAESAGEVDEELLQEIDRLLDKSDPKRRTLKSIQEELWTASRNLVEGYRDAGLPMMVMDVSWRLGTDLHVPGLLGYFEEAMRSSGKTLDLWELAYNESDLEGWDATDDVFQASGIFIESSFREYSGDEYDFQSLALDQVTSGDFSLQADVEANTGEVNFCGLVFGRKDATNFHALVLFPPRPEGEGRANLAKTGSVNLASFYGGSSSKTWRSNKLNAEEAGDESKAGNWITLRIDVVGNLVDAWVDGELIATQEFPSKDVLFGSFGLITGPGKARFKEVRFLKRHGDDPAAALQREVKLEELRQKGGGAIGDSYLGQRAPWPIVGRWAQGERSSWDEAGIVPQLLVLWSIEQNGIIAIDTWLNDLARKYEDAGLRIVSVCSPNDEERIDAYLAEHPFPGDVAVDFREAAGIGDTNKLFFTHHHGLPRLLLIDVDGRVAWEGDPGFTVAEPYRPGVESFLELPLDTLVTGRKLKELAPWAKAWEAEGQAALHAGDFEGALPLLRKAQEFDGSVLPMAYDAQRALTRVASAVDDLPATGEAVHDQERDPALDVLLDWAEAMQVEPDRAALAGLKPFKASKPAKDWSRALKQIASWRKKIEKDPAEAVVLADKLGELEGAFPAAVSADLRAAAPAGDVEALLDIVDAAPEAPRRWLARDFFGW